MPLFEVDARRSALVQPVAPGDTTFIRHAEPVVDDHVSRLLGEQIFPVVQRAAGVRAEDAPHLLALDAAGQPVVIEMVARLDAASLALALAHAGRAGRLTLADVADRFPDGLAAFETAYDEFRRKSPIARTRGQREGSRLLLLCAQVDPAVTDALDFLRVTDRAVTVLRLGVVTGPDGRRLVEVEPLQGAARRAGAPGPAPAAVSAPHDEPDDATVIRPALRVPPPAPAPREPALREPAPREPAPASAPERVSALPERPALSDRYGLPNRRTPNDVPVPAPAPASGSTGPTRVSTRAAARAAASTPSTAPVPPPPVLAHPPVEDDMPRASEPFTPRSEASASPLPARPSRAERRRAASDAAPAPRTNVFEPHPSEHTTTPLSAPLSSPLPMPSPQTPLHGDPADDDPDLFMLAHQLGQPTPLVWYRPRRGERFEAILHPAGQIELPGVGRYRNPDAAATAAVGSRREDGWDVWRLGETGPSLTEVFREQFA